MLLQAISYGGHVWGANSQLRLCLQTDASISAITKVVPRSWLQEQKYEELAQNDLEGQLMASPAVVENDLLLRTGTHLYRIGSNK